MPQSPTLAPTLTLALTPTLARSLSLPLPIERRDAGIVSADVDGSFLADAAG